MSMMIFILKCGCTNLAMVDDTGLPAYNAIHPQVNIFHYAAHIYCFTQFLPLSTRTSGDVGTLCHMYLFAFVFVFVAFIA